MNSARSSAPPWRHDGYTLRRLSDAVREAVALVLPMGHADACVVDLGAGDQPYRHLFEERGARYLAFDIDAPEPRRLYPGQPLPLSAGSTQAVVSFQVLEHVWDLDGYLGEAHRLLSDDGALILSTHGTWLYHPHPTDFRRWTRDGLLKELATRGFHAERVVALVGPLAWTTQFRTLAYHHLLAKVPLFGSALSAVLCTLMYARMWLEDAVTPAALRHANAAVYLVVARKSPPADEH